MGMPFACYDRLTRLLLYFIEDGRGAEWNNPDYLGEARSNAIALS
jgi:hypothetical protein